MSLEKKIEEKLNETLKNKDKNTFPTLRLIISAIKDTKIAKKVRDSHLSDQDVTSILKKMVKQRNDSCEAYKKAGRTELLKTEQNEINIINSFLPKQLDENETKKICEKTAKELSATTMKDMGKIIGKLKSTHGDQLDFGKVSVILKGILNQWWNIQKIISKKLN